MSQEFHEHWLSAYLDDELSSEERALVERQLAEDPQTRELLADLRRVRGLVATLPNWQGKDFQFDMNRLASSELNDEDDTELLGSKPDSRAAHGSTSTEKSNTARSQPAKPASSGISPAVWRGALSLAAGILLLILCVPLFWQNFATPLAMERAAPGAQARIQSDNIRGAVGEPMGEMSGMGGGLGGGTNMPSEDIAYGTMAEAAPVPAMPATPAEFDATQNFSRVSPPSAPASRSSLPPPQSMAAGGARGGLPGLGQPADPAAAAETTGLRMETANIERNRNAPQAKRVESPSAPAALSEMKASSLGLNIATDKQLMFAKSAAWSDAEVAAALPQLHSVVPGSIRLSEASGAGKQQQPEGANEWLITNLPPTADFASLFTQTQTTHALQPIQLGGAAEPDRTTPRDKAMADQVPVDEPAKPLSSSKEQTLNGNIVLFVTDSEARQILSSVLGSSTGGYWRVKPPQSNKPEQPTADGNAKVILLLKQSP